MGRRIFGSPDDHAVPGGLAQAREVRGAVAGCRGGKRVSRRRARGGPSGSGERRDGAAGGAGVGGGTHPAALSQRPVQQGPGSAELACGLRDNLAQTHCLTGSSSYGVGQWRGWEAASATPDQSELSMRHRPRPQAWCHFRCWLSPSLEVGEGRECRGGWAFSTETNLQAVLASVSLSSYQSIVCCGISIALCPLFFALVF